MAKGVKDGTVRIDAAELAALMRQASPSRLAVVRAAQDYRRALEALNECEARARAMPARSGRGAACVEQDDARTIALDRLLDAALAVAMDDE